ncbi:MAG: hypothetical protein K6L73_03850 [Cellvibrionaceae bacterium]
MSFTLLAIFLMIALIAVIAYGAISQSIENTRKKKQRVHKALQARFDNFSYILDAFPEGFLNSELQLLVCRCITDDLEKLTQLEPHDPLHIERLAHYTQLSENIKLHGHQAKRVTLSNPNQIKEVRSHLSDLNKFIVMLQKRGTISTDQMNNYQLQIKNLMVQVSLDTYQMAATRAIEREKYRLAYHYFDLAKKILMKDGDSQSARQLQAIEQKMSELEPMLEEEVTTAAPPKNEDDAWAKFDEEESQFKRKNLYDD